jgi:ribosomal protein S18 acetylase RimI-like enzyme
MFWGAIPFMDFIYTEPDFRRRGVAMRLLAEWERTMFSRGLRLLMTSSVADEPEPQAWHEARGFRRAGSLDLAPHQSEAEVFFVKSL